MHYSTIHKEKFNKVQQRIKLSYYFIFIWSSTCFGRNTAHHGETKTALAASGFSYVEGWWTCSWWTLSGTVCQCSFRLLMMGGVSPETCWASYKYGIIKKFWYIVASCWIFFTKSSMRCRTEQWIRSTHSLACPPFSPIHVLFHQPQVLAPFCFCIGSLLKQNTIIYHFPSHQLQLMNFCSFLH